VCVVDDELLPPHDRQAASSRATVGAVSTGSRLRLRSSSDPELSSNNVHGSGLVHGGRTNRGRTIVVTGAVVPTFNVTDSVPALLNCTDELDKLHVGAGVAAGVMAQLKFTVPVNELTEVKARLKFAVCPALIVCEVDDGVIVKSGSAITTRETIALFVAPLALPRI